MPKKGVKANGKLMKGYRYAKGGCVVKAKKPCRPCRGKKRGKKK